MPKRAFPTDPSCRRPLEIMIVGTYHFVNPGLDAKNVEAAM